MFRLCFALNFTSKIAREESEIWTSLNFENFNDKVFDSNRTIAQPKIFNFVFKVWLFNMGLKICLHKDE